MMIKVFTELRPRNPVRKSKGRWKPGQRSAEKYEKDKEDENNIPVEKEILSDPDLGNKIDFSG